MVSLNNWIHYKCDWCDLEFMVKVDDEHKGKFTYCPECKSKVICSYIED